MPLLHARLPIRDTQVRVGQRGAEDTQCDLCADRISAGLLPRCTQACPTEAVQFGNREELLAEAKQRIAAHPDKYVPDVYGEHEIGGTRFLYLSGVPFSELGFPELSKEPPTKASENQMYAVPGIAAAALAVFGGVAWLGRRKNELQAAESQPDADDAAEKTKDDEP